jgi:hypothetical protein
LKHLDATVATYKRRHMKQLKKNVSETIAKTPEKYCKHMQHTDETLATDV